MKNKGILKSVVIVGLVLMVLTGIVFGILVTKFPPEKVKLLITEQVEKLIGRKIEIGKAGVSIYPVIGFALTDVAIANTGRDGFSKEKFARFNKFMIQISVLSLFKGQPEVSKIIVSKPVLMIEVDTAGAFNFDDLTVLKKDTTKIIKEKPKGMPVLPIPLSLREFTIVDGKFIYRDARSKQDIIVNDIDDRIMFWLDKELTDVKTEGTLSLSDIHVKTAALTKPLTNLTFSFSHEIGANLKDGNVTIAKLRLSLQKLYINATGSITHLNENPHLDCTITTDTVVLQEILDEIPKELAPVLKKMTASGKLTLGLEVKGNINEAEKLGVSGTLSINDGSFKMADLPKSVNQINLESYFTKDSLDVKVLKLKFGDDPVALRAKVVHFAKPDVDLKLLASVNLGNIKEFAELPSGTELDGMVKADIQAKGLADPSDPSRINVDGIVSIENAKIQMPPLVKPVIVNGTIKLSNKEIIKALSISIGRSKLNLDAEIKNILTMVFPDSTRVLPRPTLSFTVASSLLDIDEFMPPPDTSKMAKEKSTKKSNAPLIAPLPGVDVKGTVTAGHIIYNKIPMNDVKVIVAVVNDIANIDLKTGFAGGTITENLHANLQNTHEVSFTNAVSVQDVGVDELMGNFGFLMSKDSPLTKELSGLHKSLFGKIRLSSQLSGKGGTSEALLGNLQGNAGFLMADGMIKNSIIGDKVAGAVDKFVSVKDIKFKNMSVALKIADGSVIVEKFNIPSDAGDWNISGSVGFDAGLSLSLSNRLPKDASMRLLDVQNKGKGALKGLLQGSQYASAAASLVDNTGIPSDNEGRVTALLSLGGTVTDPKVGFQGFAKGTGQGQKQQPSPREQVMSKVNEKVDKLKDDAQKKLEEERARAEALVKQKAAEQKQVVEEKKGDVEQQLKKSAASKLKKLF